LTALHCRSSIIYPMFASATILAEPVEHHLDHPENAILPTACVVVVAILLLAGLKWFRRKIRQPDAGPPGGFTLSDLRRLVKEGKMTPEEFDRAKELVLGAHKRSVQIQPPQETISNKQFPPPA
jgi:hypothetical protein